jgi:hypothetical protein
LNQLEDNNVVVKGGSFQPKKPIMNEDFEDTQIMFLAKLDALKKNLKIVQVE